MAVKRMRVFAGPNGSGKTTIFKGILEEEKIQLGIYVNADDLEKELNLKNSINFSDFNLSITEEQLTVFFKESSFSPIKRQEPDLWKKLTITDNCFICKAKIDSYLAADLAEFIRQQLLLAGNSFTYETVMSYPGKIDFLQQAIQKGYKVYLYYIATVDPEININRVNVRVAQDGHMVSPEIIRKRYYKSLENLKNAVMKTNRAYIFDNSQVQAKLIAEITEGSVVYLNDVNDVPIWVDDYLLQKNKEVT
ncbi:MAG: zeta toxin family protein [Bacteroidota bacterium]